MQRCQRVEVGDVHCHEVCAFCRDDSVEEHLSHQHFRSDGGYFARIVDPVYSNSESSLIGFSLFGSYYAHKLPIHYVSLAFFWDLMLINKLNGVGGVCYPIVNAIC